MSLRRVDFLQPASAAPRIGFVLLAIGVAALATAIAFHRHGALQREAMAQRWLQEAEAERLAQEQRDSPPTPTAEDLQIANARKERRRPWLAALRAVEAASRDPVFLLTLSADAGSGLWRLEGEAPSFEHALAYVQVLPDGVGLASASLLSHEAVQDPLSGRATVRFSASARWSAR